MPHDFLFTSESVTEGHPDKLCDQISDAVLDDCLAKDPLARVACEVMATQNLIIVAGEISAKQKPDFAQVARETIKKIGYDHIDKGLDYKTVKIQILAVEQSQDIAQGVNEGVGLHQEQGAGDQGLMFGYATKETKELMPMAISCAHQLTSALAKSRHQGAINYLRPDGKSQVTVEYRDNQPYRINTVVISTQHEPDVAHQQLSKDMIQLCHENLPRELLDDKTIFHINPTGRFVHGGPAGDCGLTGRKIIVDTYGGMGRHGGGAFSGKDPSKVDRSAAYAARYIAKNIVAAKLATECEVQLSYAIGFHQPVSININTFGTSTVQEQKIIQALAEIFPLSPKWIIDKLQLKYVRYLPTACYGHFGRDLAGFTWEQLDLKDQLAAAVS